jgi:anionic cell wall polymer biosynthesis LytR-Cps2A-Psr (LCP) family protein
VSGLQHPDERPPRPGLSFLGRAFGSVVVIVLLAAAATATAGLLQIKEELATPADAPPPIKPAKGVIEDVKPGKPQTILILGSDRRWSDLKKNNPALRKSNPARSDTIMLGRMDPDQEATAVMSIPRDLKVLIPGYGVNKINAAYSLGGPALTLKTVRSVTKLPINHVINVHFNGFWRAVNGVG